MVITPSSRVEIIAETANAHRGREAELLLLISLTAAAGVDGVKAQLVIADELCTPDHRHFELFRQQELPEPAWVRASSAAHAAGCKFYVDVFGAGSMALAEAIGADGVKLHASDTANRALIEFVARSSIPRVLLATGGALRHEIAAAVEILVGKQVVLVHGFQGYPTGVEDNQIARIARLRSEFSGAAVGFADHVPFNDPARMWLAAIAIGAGATVIEKHVTLATVSRGLDYDAALNPDEMAQFVANMRAAALADSATALDAHDFGMSAAERSYRENARKALVAARDLSRGTVLRPDDIALKRSGRPEASAMDPADAVGRELTIDVPANEPIHAGLLLQPPSRVRHRG